jgi:hypothetical protein
MVHGLWTMDGVIDEPPCLPPRKRGEYPEALRAGRGARGDAFTAELLRRRATSPASAGEEMDDGLWTMDSLVVGL